MNNKEALKNLFEKASQQAPLLDEEAVRALLVSGGSATKSNFKKPTPGIIENSNIAPS